MAGPGSDAVIENLVLAIEAAGFPEATAAVGELQASIVGLQDEVAGLAVTMGDASAAGAAGGGAAARGGKGGLFKSLTGFKALLAGLGVVEATKKFASFQAQMERLRTQTGSTQAEVGHMTPIVEGLAIKLGFGPNALAEALYHIESAGYRGQKALTALEVSAKGAQIGGANLTETTQSMVAVMEAGFKGVHSLEGAMGALNKIVGAGDMTMEQLNDALSTGILATVKQLGLEIPDLGAALATLGDNNIRGAAAATRLRMGLMMLVHPSEAAQKAMHKLGLQPLQLSEALEKPNGLLVMLKTLHERLKGFSKPEVKDILATIFGGGRNSAAMLELYNQMTKLEEKYRMVNKGAKTFGEDWSATTKTLRFFGDQVKALAEVGLIKLGAGLNAVIVFVKHWVSALEHGKVWAVAIAGAVLGLTIVFGGEAIAAGAASVATLAFGAAMALLTAIPIVAVITGIVVAVYLLITHFSQVKKVALDAWHWIEQAASDTFGWVKQHWPLLAAIILMPFLGPLGVIYVLFKKQIIGAAEAVWKWLRGAWHEVGKIVAWPFEQGAKVISSVFNWIVSHIEWAVHQIEKLLGKVLGPIKSVLGFGGKVLHAGSSVLGDVGGFFGLASGTPQVTQGGAFMVGEQGPELVYLPRGSAVQSNDQLNAQTAGGRSYVPITIALQVDRRTLAKQTVLAGLEAQSAR